MSLVGELEHLGRRMGADVGRFAREGAAELGQHVADHPQALFELLRTVKPVLFIHDIAIVTRYADVVEVLTNDEAFGVDPYTPKMQALVGDFVLGLDDSPEYERQVSILRLAAPRADVPGLAGFVSAQAQALVAQAGGRIEVPDLARRMPARLAARWLGTPGPDSPSGGRGEDALIAWTLAMFEDVFVNVGNDPGVHAAAVTAAAQWRSHLGGLIAARKASGGTDDVLGRLLAMQANPATGLSDREVAASLTGLVVGFIPTVATVTASAFDVLLDRPEALAGAQAAARADDDEGVRAHMWEAMRFAPQGPGLVRRALSDFVVAAGTPHATTIPARTVTFAATQSAMLDGDVVDDPEAFRVGRPAHHYLHFGAGLHTCFGRFANAMQIPLIAKALLRRTNLARAPGEDGKLVKAGPYPASMALTFDP